jgi:hypothetical protein
MEIQKRMFPNLSNFAVRIGSFVTVADLMALVRASARSMHTERALGTASAFLLAARRLVLEK